MHLRIDQRHLIGAQDVVPPGRQAVLDGGIDGRSPENPPTGQIQGMDDSTSGRVVTAEVPLSEMFGYATDLRSATQGRATYTMEFKKYAETPNNIAEEIIARNKS